METIRLDGKAFSDRICDWLKPEISRLKNDHQIQPALAVVLVGDDPASHVYVRNKIKRTEESGMRSLEFRYDLDVSEAEILAKVTELNNDPAVNGILVQLPLPKHINAEKVIQTIDPAKDVDGFHVINAGQLITQVGNPLVPCTPYGCLLLLRDFLGSLSGRDAVVVGRSNIVGKPMISLLVNEGCTVTCAHSRTKDLGAVTRQAEILVVGVGVPELIKGDMIMPGATVIDVGINRIDGENGKTRLVGDVAYQEALGIAKAITPVPGGVGPMTIAMLLHNTLRATCGQNGLPIVEFS